MNIHEASERYGVPLSVLEEYERRGLCDRPNQAPDAPRYSDRDLERLSTFMTLLDAGLDQGEAAEYMALLLNGGDTRLRRLAMLNRRRNTLLDEVHIRERQLERLDYLRYQMQTHQTR